MTPAYRDMDDDARADFLLEALHIIEFLDRIEVEGPYKPAMIAVWSLSVSRDSMANFYTHYTIDPESCIDEAVRHGARFFANLAELATAKRQLVPDMPAEAHAKITRRAARLARQVGAPGYRNTIADVLERFFDEHNAKKPPAP